MSNNHDFRASQIQTNKIIATGSTDTNAKILIYPIDAQNNSNPNTGEINPQAFSTSSIGEDVFLYVSGVIGGLNNNTYGVSVFGGDLYISGNLYLQGTTNISGSGGTGTTSASYLLLGNNLALPNERKFAVGAGLSENDGGAHGNYTVSAPFVSATFLTVNSESLLPNERRLIFGTGLSSSDGGSNNGLTASIDNTVVATLTGSIFTGQVKFNDGVSGSIQALSNGLPYIISGPNINIITNSLGQLEISGTVAQSGGAGEVSASYLVLSATSSLANERVFSVGTGLSSSDGGANGNFHVTAPFVSATFLTVNSETLLPNERSLVFGTGLSSSDGGANNGLTASIDNTVVATLTGSVFTGPVIFNGGLTGSLQQISLNTPYLLAQGSLTITTQSNGQIILSSSGITTQTFYSASNTGSGYNIYSGSNNTNPVNFVFNTITGSGGTVISLLSGTIIISSSLTTESQSSSGGEVSASYLVLSATSSLANERVFSVGTGLSSSDGGAGNNFHITAPFISASYITFTSESLLPNERILTAGSGTTIVDNGANSTLIINAPENFSYKTIVTNSTVIIPTNQQMIYDGTITINGDLVIDGELVQNNDSLIAFGLQITSSNIVYTTASQVPSASQFLKSVSGTHAEFQSFYTFRTTISSSNQTLLNGSFYKFNTSGGALTNISLSNPATSEGAYMKLMKTSTDSNTITIVSPSGGNINATLGTTGLAIGGSGRQGFALDCDGTDWWLTPFVAF
jgi:hypothetical protein